MNKLLIIGLGIEGREGLSKRTLKLIESSDILIGGERHLACFPKFNGEKVIIKSNLKGIEKIIEKKREEKIVILASGDPTFYGIASPLIKKFGKDRFEIIPNVTTMQAAFSRIKEGWHDAKFISFHGRDKGGLESCLLNGFIRELTSHQKIGILTDHPVNTPSKIARIILEAGITDYHVYICEELGTEKEKITNGSLQNIATKNFSPLNVMILIKKQKSEASGDCPRFTDGMEWSRRIGTVPTRRSKMQEKSGLCSGTPDDLFSHPRGMITKEEIRVIVLSKLELKDNSILWDIGAGSGSISVGTSLQMGNGKIFAIEKDTEMVRYIGKNKDRFGAMNLEIINQEAPSCLNSLPVPDAIFIGGSGGKALEIMEVSAERLKREGRLIVNAISLETLSIVANFLSKIGWDWEIISVNISKTKELNKLHVFSACNPVFIIVTRKP